MCSVTMKTTKMYTHCIQFRVVFTMQILLPVKCIFSLITIQPDRTGKYCNNLKIFVSTEGINIIIIIIVQRYYLCTVHRIKSISRNRANLIAPPPSCVANVRFNIGRYPGENKSAGNSIRYLGTAIHRKRLIFAVGNPATEYRGSRVPAFHVFQPCPQWY